MQERLTGKWKVNAFWLEFKRCVIDAGSYDPQGRNWKKEILFKGKMSRLHPPTASWRQLCIDLYAVVQALKPFHTWGLFTRLCETASSTFPKHCALKLPMFRARNRGQSALVQS